MSLEFYAIHTVLQGWPLILHFEVNNTYFRKMIGVRSSFFTRDQLITVEHILAEELSYLIILKGNCFPFFLGEIQGKVWEGKRQTYAGLWNSNIPNCKGISAHAEWGKVEMNTYRLEKLQHLFFFFIVKLPHLFTLAIILLSCVCQWFEKLSCFFILVIGYYLRILLFSCVTVKCIFSVIFHQEAVSKLSLRKSLSV